MFFVSKKQMTVACAEAGILGSMPSLNARTTEQFSADLAWIRACTDKPFGIDLAIGLTPNELLEADSAACVEHEVPVLITSYGNPTDLAARAHERGITVFHDVISPAHAKKAEAAGMDAIIAGAGGHAGCISPFVLYPWLDAELLVPIIAAGCITTTGQQLVASLSLGTQLCYIGTRFIASTEYGAADAYEQKVVTSDPEDIVYTDAVSGIHANFLEDTVPEGFTRDHSPDGAKRWRDIWSAGRGVGLIDSVQPIGRIVEGLVRDAQDTYGKLA